jgi:hypothetical protein
MQGNPVSEEPTESSERLLRVGFSDTRQARDLLTPSSCWVREGSQILVSSSSITESFEHRGVAVPFVPIVAVVTGQSRRISHMRNRDVPRILRSLGNFQDPINQCVADQYAVLPKRKRYF